MNKQISILVLTALIVFSSCSIKEDLPVEEQRLPRFHGVMEMPVDDAGTKAFVKTDNKLFATQFTTPLSFDKSIITRGNSLVKTEYLFYFLTIAAAGRENNISQG